MVRARAEGSRRELIQIDIALRRRFVRVRLGLLEQLVELLLQNFSVNFFRFERFLERLFTPSRRAFEFSYFSGEILDGLRLFRNLVRNHRTSFRVYLEKCLAAGASHIP